MTGRAPRHGTLIAVEGIDGSGKSTLLRLLARRLRHHGTRVVVWREPVDRELGARAQRAGRTDPWSAALLFTLDRARARPALERALTRADVVLSDRSFYSTLAYQASALSDGEATIVRRLQRQATRRPDRVLWLKIDVPTAMRRLAVRNRSRDPLERTATLQRVARAYATLARAPGWMVLDARRPPGELADLAAGRLTRMVAHRPRR
ncbi:MAG: dTMP kinase [Thermoplasmata archaeon]|nr:dTMP kinase [Thermoplasmata archaeon]